MPKVILLLALLSIPVLLRAADDDLPPLPDATIAPIGGTDFSDGWAAGAAFQRNADLEVLINHLMNCEDAAYFDHVSGASDTWNANTCRDTLKTAYKFTFSLDLSTPTKTNGQ